MTELETIQRAKMYLDKLANGIDPLTDQPVPENDVVNQVRISRCLFYTSDILRRIIEQGGVTPEKPVPQSVLPAFSMDYQLLRNYAYSEEPISITQVINRINDLVPPNETKRLTFTPVTKWLMEHGYLAEELNARGGKSRRPTPAGMQIGIFTDYRSGPNGDYMAVLYRKEAQAFIVQHLSEMLG